MIQIGNDGNLLPNPVTLTELDEQGIAERYDIVIDFSQVRARRQAAPGQPLRALRSEDGQLNGKKPSQDLTLAAALSGKSPGPVRRPVPRVPRRPRARRSPT